jgi:hypothetical protein
MRQLFKKIDPMDRRKGPGTLKIHLPMPITMEKPPFRLF